MGVSTSPFQLAGKLEKFAVALEKQQKAAALDGAKVLKAGAERAMNAAAPGGHLRNIKNSRLTVSVTTTGDRTALVSANGGAYAILDNPTRAHWIGQGRSTKKPKRGAFGPARPSKRAGTRSPIKIGNTWVTGPVLHPGTKGKHTFNAGTLEAQPEAFQTMVNSMRAPMGKIFS